MRYPNTDMRRMRSAIGNTVAATIIAGGIFGLSCGGSPANDDASPVGRFASQADDQALEITTFPGEGDTVRNLDRPLVVEFSGRVEPEAFT